MSNAKGCNIWIVSDLVMFNIQKMISFAMLHQVYFFGLVQGCNNSIAKALQLL